MSISSIQRLLAVLDTASAVLGRDASLRQLATFLQVAKAAEAGADSMAVQAGTDSSQASASRNLKLLAVEHGLVEFFLDQADGRRRLVRLLPKGKRLLDQLMSVMSAPHGG